MAYDYDAGLPLSPESFVPHAIPRSLAVANGWPLVGHTVRPTHVAMERREPIEGRAGADEVTSGGTYTVVATGTGVVSSDISQRPELVWLVVRNAPLRDSPVCRYLTAAAWVRERSAWGNPAGDSAWEVVPE
jgi:hypothetical protein